MSQQISNAYQVSRKKVSSAFSAIVHKIKQLDTWLGANPQWISAALVIVLGMVLAEWIEADYAFVDLRYRGYQITENLATYIKGGLYDHHTVLILIEDDEYWAGAYEGRSPINKTHLAELINALDQYRPKVIALDFNFTSPVIAGRRIIEHHTYKTETEDLMKALRELTSKPKIILPRTLGIEDGYYVGDVAVYDQFDLSGARFGYIDLPGDYRLIPHSLPMKDGTRLDSFSEAVVRAFDLTGEALKWDRNDGRECYASGFLSEDQFAAYSATQVLFPDETTRERLAHQVGGNIVIVGGAWSKDGYGRGTRIDSRDTPVGEMPAVFLHGAWVESMLGTRTARPMGDLQKWTLELLVGFLTYYVFTRNGHDRKIRYLLRCLYLLGLALFWLGIAYFSSQNLGLFFDPLIPSLASIGKAAFEQVNDWRIAANLYEEQLNQVGGQHNEIASLNTPDPIYSNSSDDSRI